MAARCGVATEGRDSAAGLAAALAGARDGRAGGAALAAMGAGGAAGGAGGSAAGAAASGTGVVVGFVADVAALVSAARVVVLDPADVRLAAGRRGVDALADLRVDRFFGVAIATPVRWRRPRKAADYALLGGTLATGCLDAVSKSSAPRRQAF